MKFKTTSRPMHDLETLLVSARRFQRNLRVVRPLFVDGFLRETAGFELAHGTSRMATSAFNGMRGHSNRQFNTSVEPVWNGVSPCDAAQTYRLKQILNDRFDVPTGWAIGGANRCGVDAFRSETNRGSASTLPEPRIETNPDGMHYRKFRDNTPTITPEPDVSAVLNDLTRKQHAVAALLSMGLNPTDISGLLGIQRANVYKHIRAIRRDLTAAGLS